jgi:hypothetical protein
MSRPDWCDEATWKAAHSVFSASISDGPEPIARALVAAEQRGAEREREACALLIEEGFEREIGRRWRPDGKPSNLDWCIHDREVGADCEQCAAAAIRGRNAME